MPRSGIAQSSGNAMSNFLRNCQTDFQSGCTSLQYHHQWRSVPLSPHPCQYLLSPEFFILDILTGVRWISGLFGNTETKCGVVTEGKAMQRLLHLGIYPMYSHQTQTLLWIPISGCWQESDRSMRGSARAWQVQRRMLTENTPRRRKWLKEYKKISPLASWCISFVNLTETVSDSLRS